MSPAELHVVELRMASGTWYTLRQVGWDETDDDSGPFLARAGELYVFRSPGELLAWCAAPSDTEHELVPSPLWTGVRGLTAAIRDEDRFDLTWSDLPAEGPVPAESIPALHGSAAVLDDLLVGLDLDGSSDDAADAADDPDVSALYQTREVMDLLFEPEHLDGPLSGRRRERLADVLRAHGSAVTRLVERRLTLPEPTGSAGPPVDPVDPVAPGSSEPSGTPEVAVPLEDVAGVETVWVGLVDRGFYTLREIASAGDAPAYLGSAGRLIGAAELTGLRRWLGSPAAVDGPHDLLAVPGWSALVAGADAVDLDVYDDDVVDLAEVGARLDTDLDLAGADAMNDAWLLLADLADWGGWDDVRAALEPDRPVGFVLSAVLPEIGTGDPRGARRLGELDLDALREAWAALVAAVDDRVDLVG